MRLTLRAQTPFNFHTVVHSHGWYQLAPMQYDNATQSLETVERLSDNTIVGLRFGAGDDGVQIESPGRFSKAALKEVEAKARWMLMLDSDFSAFYAMADREPRLAHCRASAQGRFLRSATVWEDIVKVMLTTNIQWGGTKRLVRSLVEKFGDPLADDSSRRAFPTPARIARSRETTLRALGLGYRAPYLMSLARGVASNKIALEPLTDTKRPTEDVRRDLLSLPGIGPYAAATMLGILGRYDYIGVDTEAISLVSKGFYGGKPVGAKEIEAVFGRWGRYKLLAYWFWDWHGKQQSPMEAYASRQ